MKEKKLFENVSVSKISKMTPITSVRPKQQFQKQNTFKDKTIEDDNHRKIVLEKLAQALIAKPLENENQE